jgi:phospholipase D-like protein
MSGNRGCLMNSILFLVIILVPLLGHILVSLMILEDDHSVLGKVLWLLVVWLMPIPVVIGPLLYLLFGQKTRSSRVMFGQPSYAGYQAQSS